MASAQERAANGEEKTPKELQELRELEAEYLETTEKYTELKDRQLELLKKIMPRQTAILKAIIEDRDKKIKLLEEKNMRSNNLEIP